MKIHWVFSTFAVGGPQRRFASLAAAMGPDHQHVVSSMDGRYEAEALIPATVWARVRPLSPRKGRFVSAANLAQFSDILDEERPDLLVTTNWGAIEWAFAARGAAGHVHCEDGFGPDERADRQKFTRVLTRRLALRRVDAVAVPSLGLAQAAGRLWRVPARKLFHIPNGVATRRFAEAGARRAPELGRPLVIGAVGALRPEKRFDRLIRMFAALSAARDDLRLMIVGDGWERENLRAQAAALNLADRIEFAGEQAEVAPFLARMDLFALTSDTEQAPLALIEAMASGLPAVCADVGDCAAMLAPANRAYVTPSDDEAGLTRRAAALLADAALRREIGGANAARAAADYDLEVMAGRWTRMFESVLAARITAGRALTGPY